MTEPQHIVALPEVHLRYPAKAYNEHGEHIGPGPWLTAIWEANTIEPKFFDGPDFTGPWWAGGSVEEYEHARVIHRDDGSVSIASKTEHGAEVLRQVSERGK